MINSDNGGECVNGHIKRHFSQFLPSVVRTRSRSYRKNDNAHVEQKNGAQARALYGHGRIGDESLIPLMNRINRITSYNVCYTKLLRCSSSIRPWP